MNCPGGHLRNADGVDTGDVHPALAAARRRAYTVGAGWIAAGSAIASLRVLPDVAQVALVIATWGGAPLAARYSGFRLLADLPDDERGSARAAVDDALLGSAQIDRVGCGWILTRLAIAIVVIVVACLLLLSL